MEVLNTVIFYILTLICILSAVFCLFQKNIMNSAVSAAILFLDISGFYFLLGAAYLACVQILLFTLGMTVFMLFCTATTNAKDNKSAEFFSLKTLFAPVLAVIFAFLTIPFILYQFKGYKTLQSFSISDFALNLYKNNAFAFEIIGVLLFTAIIGITAVIIVKNTHKTSDIEKIKGENG